MLSLDSSHKLLRTEVLKAFKSFWTTWAERTEGLNTLEQLKSFFDPEVTSIGTGAHEKGSDYAEVVENFRADLSELYDPISMDFANERVRVFTPEYGSVEATADLRIDLENGELMEMFLRFTTILAKREGRWLIVHNHVSIPSSDQAPGEAYPVDALLARNKQLLELVEERTMELHEKTLQLEELSTFKNRFFTNLAHEFRTPLTVILGMSDTLAKQVGGEQAQKLAMIERNGRGMLRLVNQLMDLSKLEDKSLLLNWVNSDIVPILRHFSTAFSGLAKQKKINQVFHSEVDSLVMDFAPRQLQSILWNLLSNAFKFTPAKGQIGIRLSLLDDQRLCIRVCDTGQGIAAEDQLRIFDRFYQARTEAKAVGLGTGIGLAHTKELTELMGGNIQVESDLGAGSCFYVRLPIRNEVAEQIDSQGLLDRLATARWHSPEAEASELEVAVAEKAGSGQGQSEEKPLLLLVEDNADLLAYLHECLHQDYELHMATDGQIGIEKAVELVPDLIISDVMMPRKNGYELCASLKNDERTSHIPIILLTAKTDTDAKLEGLLRGADAYLAKPFVLEELKIRLQNLHQLRSRLRDKYQDTLTKTQVAETKSTTIEDEFLTKVLMEIEAHLDDTEFNGRALARTIFLSESQLARKLKALVGTSPARYIRRVRLQRAMELLQASDDSITNIAFEVGFNDPAYFSRAFSAEFGQPPMSFKVGIS